MKDYALPLAMLTGVFTHQWVRHLAFLTPYFIFAMLLITFCKIDWKDIRFHPAHLWLLLIQLVGSAIVYLLIRLLDETVAQGALLCMLAPTATAAAVITGMLGGNVGFLTSYVLLCNVAVAVVAPVYFSVIGVHEHLPFLQSVGYICGQVFPLLIAPLLIAGAIRRFVPGVHRALVRLPRLTFYLWTFSLTVVMGVTVDFILNRDGADLQTVLALAGMSLAVCCVQFLAGRRIGRAYGDAVSAGQGLGQKNTILALWMAQTYLHPLISIAPATYIIWQNIINSYQLWRKNHMAAPPVHKAGTPNIK